MLGLHQHVEGQSAVGEGVRQKAVLQQIRVLNIGGRRDSLIGLQVLKEACCLWIQNNWLLHNTFSTQFYNVFQFHFFFYLTDRKACHILVCSLYDLQHNLNPLIVVRAELYERDILN